MLSVVKNVLECFELHLRGSNNLKFSGKPAPNPTSNASFVFIQYTTRKGSKAYLSSSERYLTLHIIRHRH